MVSQQQSPKVHYRCLTPALIQTGQYDDYLQAVEHLCRQLASELGLGDAESAVGIRHGFADELRPPNFACLVAEIDVTDDIDLSTSDKHLLLVKRDCAEAKKPVRLVVTYCVYHLSFTLRNGLELMLEHIMVHRDYRNLGIGQKCFVHMAKHITQTKKSSGKLSLPNVIQFICLRQSEKTWRFYRNVPKLPEFSTSPAILENLTESKLASDGCHVWELEPHQVQHVAAETDTTACQKFDVKVVECLTRPKLDSDVRQLMAKYRKFMKFGDNSCQTDDILYQLQHFSKVDQSEEEERVCRLFTISSRETSKITGFGLFTLGMSRWGVKMFVHHTFVDADVLGDEHDTGACANQLVKSMCAYAHDKKFPYVYFYVAQPHEHLTLSAVKQIGAVDITETAGWQVAQLKFSSI